MGDPWIDRLSEYLDGELPEAERQALASHLETCEECARTLHQLESVVARARGLSDRPPTADLWPEIAARLRGGAETEVVPLSRRRRTISFTIPQLAAAAIAAIAFSATGAFLAVRDGTRAPEPIVATIEPLPVVPVVAGFDEERYGAAVSELERALAAGRGRLDTATVRILDENLRIIDRAIVDARSALAADPANAYLNQHLAQTMRRKAALLKHAAALAAASS